MKHVMTAVGVVAFVVLVHGQSERVDLAMVNRIRAEGLNRSQVMDHVFWLSDVHGPRLTGSPGIEAASQWAMKTMSGWGMTNAHQERFAFGKGWTLLRFSANMIAPQVQPLIGSPRAWSRGTNGTVTADVVRVQISTEADFAKYQGTLRGKAVIMQPVRPVRMLEGPVVLRMDDAALAEAATTPPPPAARGAAPPNPAAQAAAQAAAAIQRRIPAFLNDEGVVAIFDRGSDSDITAGGSDLSWQTQRTDGGTVFPSGSLARDNTAGSTVPAITLAVEHYNRMARLLERNVPVRVELDVDVKFIDETTPNGFNTIAELPGTDRASEIVLLGGHLDSYPYATGATDNAAGCAAIMEAMRILTAVGAKPRRTIRVALWGAEEQGLLGSRAYVRDHLADVATMALKPEHAQLSAYFNSDNGSGRVRGIWLQNNQAVEPIFQQWIAPLRDLGVTTLGPRAVASTDHSSFDDVGIPAFQLMVDRLEYNSRTHHSNMDTYDRVQKDDLVQQATVIAVLAYNAAMRDDKLPRKPLPQPQRGRGGQP
ncbi:MAG TPA: M20/M25/M40 family metallo-hydrolase [Vicinamibacterales bacterium]|nr:M20/M25/M40 family metallo-hydrolase [Vicinamibacterales bacterium]